MTNKILKNKKTTTMNKHKILIIKSHHKNTQQIQTINRYTNKKFKQRQNEDEFYM